MVEGSSERMEGRKEVGDGGVFITSSCFLVRYECGLCSRMGEKARNWNTPAYS